MKKLKLISILCALVMLLSSFAVFPVIAADEPTTVDAAGNGAGTAEDPYLIYDSNFADYYNNFNAKYSSKHVKLAEDITLNTGSATDWKAGTNIPAKGVFGKWEGAMGGGTTVLSGSFDGANHTISGICFVGVAGNSGDGAHRRVALFAGVSGTVKNLNITNSYFEGNAVNASNYNEVAGLTARFNAGATVDNCSVDAIIVNKDLGATEMASAGIVGRAMGAGTISNCTFKGTVESQGTSKSTAAILGLASGSGVNVEYCANTGTINGTGSTGGIVGLATGSISIKYCANAGTVIGAASIGGILGSNSAKVTIQNSTNNGVITANGGSLANGVGRPGGILGNNGNAETTISNCLNTGSLSEPVNNLTGGMLGNRSVKGITITKSLNLSSNVNSAIYGGGQQAVQDTSDIKLNNYYVVKGLADKQLGSGGYTSSTA